MRQDRIEKDTTNHVYLLDVVRHSLTTARLGDSGDVVAPAAVLWTVSDGEWRPVVEQVRGIICELLTLGDYDKATRIGPAIWLRCVIDPAGWTDKVPDLAWPSQQRLSTEPRYIFRLVGKGIGQ